MRFHPARLLLGLMLALAAGLTACGDETAGAPRFRMPAFFAASSRS